MKTIFTFLAVIFCTFNAYGQRKEFGWLNGTWKVENRNVFEVWSVVPSSENLQGLSYSIEKGDTTITENIKLIADEGSFYYVPDVAGDQGPVLFKITAYDSKSFVAENPQHDFPKIIRYHVMKKSKKMFLEASVEGNGKVIHYTLTPINFRDTKLIAKKSPFSW